MQTRAAAVQTVNLAHPDLNLTNQDLTDSDESDVVVVSQNPEEVLRQVADVFPDICPAYLGKLAQEKDHDSESVIDAVLLEIENGVSYPKKTSLGKRKRETDPILEVFSKSAEEFGEGDVKRLTEYFTGPVWKAQVSKIKGYRDFWYVSNKPFSRELVAQGPLSSRARDSRIIATLKCASHILTTA